jgi:tartrate dehydratase beta subunit/fumarate hydratase class I family protein
VGGAAYLVSKAIKSHRPAPPRRAVAVDRGAGGIDRDRHRHVLDHEFVAVETIARHGAAYLIAVGGAAYLVSKAIKSARVLAAFETR